ncbi:DUF2891 domain-containing protein [Aurantiacibacter marinus]|uniref:DUF2891 domain-containing protein n=1 Tax=Aurantiacibacter marinus TaxID=874156 RepID=A0A0H0XXG7_9SPHN|nr:DUF2891 domain-containing protein [Aurantiacibacter marinus]KLI64985.1 hypothetical protein AAV99_05745 [Aurantiacibacter marinus]
MILNEATAARFARTALGHVGQEYPNKLDHVMAGPDAVASPRNLHPAFYGSFDWHSCVHSWWTLLTIRRLFPDLPEAATIETRAEETLSQANLDAELAYAQILEARGFERPYGWAWLLYLHLEASRHGDQAWAERLSPLAHHFATGWRDYLGILRHPIRHGAHANTAFALNLSLQWARVFDQELAALIKQAAQRYFIEDRAAQCWEPGGDEFLSPTLTEAALMKQVLPADTFAQWFGHFLPQLEQGEPRALFIPAQVSDPTDGKAAHLDGVNFTRSWCWRMLGLDERNAHRHIKASEDAIDGDYMGSHWLASFALLAMLAGQEETE